MSKYLNKLKEHNFCGLLADKIVIAMIVSVRVVSSHNYKIAGEIELR